MLDKIMFQAEPRFGMQPAPLAPIRMHGSAAALVAPTEIDGDATIRCECGGTIDTRRACMRGRIPHGLHFQGVPCDSCDRTYTIELADPTINP